MTEPDNCDTFSSFLSARLKQVNRIWKRDWSGLGAYLALARLQPVHQAGDVAAVVGVGEHDQLLVDEVVEGDVPRRVIVQTLLLGAALGAQPSPALHPGRDPGLALLHTVLAERQLQRLVVFGPAVAERGPVPVHVGEVLAGLGRGGGAQACEVVTIDGRPSPL